MKVVVLMTGPEEDWAPAVDAGHDVVFASRRAGSSVRVAEEDVIALASDADCLVYNVIPRHLLESLPQLKAIVSPYAGYDKIDVDAATDVGVLVCNTQTPANVSSMAEATLTLMLAAGKRLRLRSRRAWDLTWRDDGTEQAVLFYGATVGIVGLGAIGKSVARHLAGWDIRLLAYTRTPNPATAAEVGVELVDLAMLLAESDVVTLHVPLTNDTRGLIGEAELRAMKPTAYLINTSRGPVVDEAAICRAIEEDWIAGVALDVFNQEPLPADSPLLSLDPNRVLLTPHSMSNADEARKVNRRAVVDSVITALAGGVPATSLNPQVASNWRGRQPSPQSSP